MNLIASLLLAIIFQGLVIPVLCTKNKENENKFRRRLSLHEGELTSEFLKSFGIQVNGDTSGLAGLTAEFSDIDHSKRVGDTFSATLDLKEGVTSIFPSNARVEDLGITEDVSVSEITRDSSLTRRNSPPVFKSCPDINGFGYANNVAIYLSTPWYKLKLDCKEKCCVRQWQCDSKTCRVTCGHYTITIDPWLKSCCRIYGLSPNPFPSGSCGKDRFLCSAN